MPNYSPTLAERYWLVELEGANEQQTRADREYWAKAAELLIKGLGAINHNLVAMGRMLAQRR